MVVVQAFSVYVGLATYAFYNIFNVLLQYLYYYKRGSTAAGVKDWKTQPSKGLEHCGKAAAVPWLPFFYFCGVRKSGRSHTACMLATFNSILACVLATTVCEAILQGKSRMYFHETEGAAADTPWYAAEVIAAAPWKAILLELLIAVIHENAGEYYWHRLEHTRFLYTRMHKVHHVNKSPEPFDDMMINPVEAFIYYCLLYSPPFIYSMHTFSFLAYMIVMGITGVLDHSGINLALFGIYDTKDHDGHHQHFNVNYGFPFPWFDLLHGTFDGTFCGVRIRPAYKMASEALKKSSEIDSEGYQGDSTVSMAAAKEE